MLAATETQPANDVLALPASSAQLRFWVLDQLQPGDPSLNVAVRFGLSGELDVAALTRALNEIVRRHEILRASFTMIDEQVVQLVAPELTIPVPVVDLREIPAADRNAAGDRLASEEARAPFRLAEAPLLRAQLLRLDESEHVLLITIHHIVSDGWSIGVITDELGEIYEAFHYGRPSPLPGLPIQYADYTIWRQQNESGSSEGEQYWTKQLADLPQFELMPDFPRTASADAPGHIVSRLLPVTLTDSLAALSRSENATLFMTMLAALAALLHRCTGETDIVTGSQVVGRNTVDVEPLIGPFINTLVLRTNASGDPTFIELLERVNRMFSDALCHQDVPLERVTELLKVERSATRNLLFQVNFIYQRDFVHPWEHAGLRMRPIPSRSPGAIHDVNVFLVERADGWRASCEYNADLFSETRIVQLLEHYEHLLAAILAEPHNRISQYRILSPGEERRILVEWNDSHAEYPRDRAFHQLFEQQAAKSPESVAVICDGASLTYRELNENANRLAHYIEEQGIAPGMLVGVCIERSVDMLVAVLAVLKAGAAYVPLDPSFPRERLSFMAADAGLRLLLTERALTNLVDAEVPKICIDSEKKSIADADPSNLGANAGPRDLAYVIYTSGSTGKPKGVAIHHQALVNLLCAIVEKPGLNSGDALLAVTTLSFDIAGLELFAPLLVGARVVIATREQAADGRQLRDLLASTRATVLQATPATWRMLTDAGWSGAPGLKMLCGGEALPLDLAEALLDRGAELWNMYGPTETTIWSSSNRIHRGDPITIGRPAANTSFYVLDANLRPVPPGAPGELFIGGDGVATGYHNRPELTAEKFLSNPFAGGRIYRTGDRARFRAGGAVELLGRMDTQVKIRGFRIELGEIEAALTACPGVRNGAVVVRQDAAGQNALAAYFVPSHDDASAGDRVREFLKQRLPGYMVPAYLIALPDLPQTPNGKIDRKALPDPGHVRAGAPSASETVEDALELTLTGIWESVIGVHPIGRNANFFEIGGHSVLAAKMFARMEQVLGKALPLATLFQAPTIAKLAALLRDSGWTPIWSSLVPIRPGGGRTPFFFVHPIGGNVVNFAGFAAHFDPEQPIYGLQARGLDGKESPSHSIEQMAADYISEVRSVQSEGPYSVGGFSAGGIVAFEMARQLRAAGQQVRMLALLDTKVDGSPQSSLDMTRKAFARVARTARFNLRYAFHVGLGTFVQQKIRNWKMRAKVRAWTIKSSVASADAASNLDVEEAFIYALRHYRPRPYDGDATLFRAKDELVSYTEPDLGWKNLINGELKIEHISGDHDTILYEPHIGMLARVLNSCLITAPEPSRLNALRQSV